MRPSTVANDPAVFVKNNRRFTFILLFVRIFLNIFLFFFTVICVIYNLYLLIGFVYLVSNIVFYFILSICMYICITYMYVVQSSQKIYSIPSSSRNENIARTKRVHKHK